MVPVGELLGRRKEEAEQKLPEGSRPAHPPLKPTTPEHDSPQMNLFRDFLYNREDEREGLSNAIELWDSIPRYSISRLAMTKSRLHGRFLDKYAATFQYRGIAYKCTISPARIKDTDGQERDYFPSATEELIEDALRKLATDQQAGFFDKPNYRSGVVFSLHALREELKERGHARSYQEIVASLNILSGSIIEIIAEQDGKGEAIARSPYMPSLVAVSRKKLNEDPRAKWAVQFHPLVTASIDQVTYRQINYDKLMKHRSQLARWLHKQLVMKFTFADTLKPFEMRYSTIKRDSWLLNERGRERAAIAATEKALKELETEGVLMQFTRKNVAGPRGKLLDVVFTLGPSLDFISEVKAANKRQLVARKNVENGNTR